MLLVTPSTKFNSAPVAVTSVVPKTKPLSVALCPDTVKFLAVATDTSPVKAAPANAAFVAIEFVTVVEKLESSFNAAANSSNVFNKAGAPPVTA